MKRGLFKWKNEPELYIPVKSIHLDTIETTEGKWAAVLRVVEPINSSLLTGEDAERAVEAIRGCVNALKAGHRLKIMLSSERIDLSKYFHYLEREIIPYYEFSGNEFARERILRQIDFLKDHTRKAKNVHVFYIVIESQYQKQIEAEDDLDDLCQHFKETLAMGDMICERLTKKELEKVIYEKLAPITSLRQPYTSDLELLAWRPPEIKKFANGIFECDDMYYRFSTLSYLPKTVKKGWLKRVFNIKANLDVNIVLEVMDKKKLIDNTNKQIAEIDSKLLGKLKPMYKLLYEKKREGLMKLLEEMQDESENLFRTSFLFCVRDTDLEELESQQKRLENQIASSGLRSERLVYKDASILFYNLPISFKYEELESRIYWPLPAKTVGSILPFDSSELNYNEGILKGINVQTGSPVIYDRFNDHIFNNPSECIFGESGSGKSWYVKREVLRASTTGMVDRIFMIDPESEYDFPHAKKIVFKLGSTFSTNPFHIRSTVVDSEGDDDGTVHVGKFLRRKIESMISFFRWIIPDLSPLEKALLLEGIQKCYEDVGLVFDYEVQKLPKVFPTLGNLVEHLKGIQDAERIVRSLKPYVDGVYSEMFNNQTNWDMDAPITIFDIRELGQEVKRPLMDLLLKEIWEEIKLDVTQKKGIYVDEAWLLADEKNEQTMEFLREIAKRVRKYRGYLVTITQNIDDFLSLGKWGSAVYKNSHIKTFFRMSEKDIAELKKIEKISEKEEKILSKKKSRGHCIHIAGAKRIEMKTVESEDEAKILAMNDPFRRDDRDDQEKSTRQLVVI